MLIYKILHAAEWQAFQTEGRFHGAAVDLSDGYIHFSTAEQAPETAAKHFADEPDLWLLAVNAAPLGEDLKWEPSRGGALFPHLYRSLDLEEVIWAKPLPLDGGRHTFPDLVP